MPTPAAPTNATFRVDRFAVPSDVLDSFMARLRITQRLLDELEGCRQNLVLLGAVEGDSVGVVTIVEWASGPAMEAAKTAMHAHYASEGFEPAAFIRQLGVRADIGSYRPQ